ncbi:MAG: hypothetical protein JNG82_15220 [Opitutaceae bacterium]|nr:hypothetical protein [Opitutaceae bacterium]
MKPPLAIILGIALLSAGFAAGYFTFQSQQRYQLFLQSSALVKMDRLTGKTWAYDKAQDGWRVIEDIKPTRFDPYADIGRRTIVPWMEWRDSFYIAMAQAEIKTREQLELSEILMKKYDTPAQEVNQFGDAAVSKP